MNKEIIYISDFFVEDVLGGGELNDREILSMLRGAKYSVEKIQSHCVTNEFLLSRKEHFFIISNFINLNSSCREILIDLEYVIYEHDHKYMKSRNPALHENFKAKTKDIINYHFYKNAKAVFCQSKLHKSIIEKNLIGLNNIISVGGNLWSLATLENIRKYLKIQKQDTCAILRSNTEHKNTIGAIRFCTHKNMKYNLIASSNYDDFLLSMAKNKKFVFLPKTPETLSRVVVEARMLGLSVTTNNLVGATGEEWFNKKGEELIDYMIQKREEIFSLIIDVLERPVKIKKKPLISIIATFYEAEKYLHGFFETITNQTIFDECELIIVDSNSPGNEQKIVESYCSKYDNIKYYRFKKRFSPTVGFNLALMNSSGKYYSWAMIDDRKSLDSLEVLYRELKSNQDVDLVYGDCLVTDIENEKLDETKSKIISEHSSYPFTRENMIKCLPGPMPMWTRRMIESVGFFNQDEYDFSDDWEMWLRCVDNNFKFKKVDKVIGLYLAGGRSQADNNISQRKEEVKLFFKYGHIFGDNYAKYYSYFNNLKGNLI